MPEAALPAGPSTEEADLFNRFPEVGIENLKLVLKSTSRYERPLVIPGPWVVFYKYPEEEHAGVTSFDSREDMIDSLDELVEEIGADILAVYYDGKYHRCRREVRWEIGTVE